MKLDSRWLTILAGSSLLISQAAWSADQETTSDDTVSESTEELSNDEATAPVVERSMYQHRVRNQVQTQLQSKRSELEDPSMAQLHTEVGLAQQSAFGNSVGAGIGAGNGAGGNGGNGGGGGGGGGGR